MQELDSVEGIVVFANENSFASPESEEGSSAALAFQVVRVTGLRLNIDESDCIAGMAMTEGTMQLGAKGRGGGSEHICEGADLAEIVTPATEGEDLSHCGVLFSG
jgi:hypothetical protein